MPKHSTMVFRPEIPPDLDHAHLVREEALEWLERLSPPKQSFTTSEVLKMGGETGRRWLIARLRAQNIGDEAEFSLPDTADALTILYLRSKGVKFHDAVDAVVKEKQPERNPEPRYGGVWNRLIISGLERLRRRIPPRLLASAVYALVGDPKDQPNCLVIVKRHGKKTGVTSGKAERVSHDYAYRAVLERPAPSCSVIAPSREVLFFTKEQLPARSEITSRHFVSMRFNTGLEDFELMLGTMRPLSINPDEQTLRFVGRILDIVFVHFESFLQTQSSLRLETPLEPEGTSADDLQIWLTARFLIQMYPGSVCEISETSPVTRRTRILASSVVKPWEPAPWEPAKSLEMLSGYASLTGVPLVVEKVEYPWTSIIEGIDTELRYIEGNSVSGKAPRKMSAVALPITLSSGSSMGSLYMLMPRMDKPRLDMEVLILNVFSRVVGEMVERHRAAVYSAEASANIVTTRIMKQEQFKEALLELLIRKSGQLAPNDTSPGDARLPFLLLAVHQPEPDRSDPAVSAQLKKWLVETMSHMEWRTFVRSHWTGLPEKSANSEGFIGEIPGVGTMMALGQLVSKDDLDRIRNAFPAAINRTSPSNSPVKFIAWVLDVPAQRILRAAQGNGLPKLAEEIERWAFDVATLVDDLAQSSVLAYDNGEWESALKRIRQGLRKPGASSNSYLRRMAADCSLALGEWPSALRYAREAAALSGQELGSGLVRSLCLEGDAYLGLCDPIASWELYSEAIAKAPAHPLPHYYRGKATLLMARLLRVYEDETRRAAGLNARQSKQIDNVVNDLVNRSLDDLTSAADLLERWGLIPELYQYKNFHLVPTLMGQALGYMLNHSPGPAASRLQSARRSFPKDDLFFREFLFAKFWEQGIHRKYAEFLLGKGWEAFKVKLG